MRRERERRQWEQEAEDELEQDKPVGPVHYQELRAGEVRTHGTAYYAFSMDEEQRREQLGLFNKLREQVWQVFILWTSILYYLVCVYVPVFLMCTHTTIALHMHV